MNYDNEIGSLPQIRRQQSYPSYQPQIDPIQLLVERKRAEIISKMLGGQNAPADTGAAEQKPEVKKTPQFHGIEKGHYIDNNAHVKDVAANPAKELSSDAQEAQKSSGLLSTTKNNVKIYSRDGKDDYTDILKNEGVLGEKGEIDRTKAGEAAQKQKEKIQDENNLTTTGYDSILSAKKGENVLKDKETRAKYGLDEGRIDDLSNKGDRQFADLRRQGIVDKDGNIQELNKAQKDYLEDKKFQNKKYEALSNASHASGDEKDERTRTYVKTEDGDGKTSYDAYRKVNRDDSGNIEGFSKTDTKERTLKGAEHIEAAAAKKQLTLGGLDDATSKEITTVGKDGSVTLDLSKLSTDKYEALAKNGGINYSGSGALTIKGPDGQPIKVHLKDDANRLKLEGKGTYDVSTEGKQLQINADKDTTVKGLQGDNLDHVVVKGGTIDSAKIGGDNLQAVKIEDAKLTQGAKISSKKDVAVNLSNVDSNRQRVTVSSEKNADVKVQHSKVGALDVKAANAAATISNTGVHDLNVNATENASVKGYKGSIINNAKVDAKNANVNYNDATVEHSDLTGVKNETGVFVGKNSKVEDLKLKEGASDKDTEIIAENEKVAQGLAVKGVTVQNLADGNMSQSQLYQKYFDLSASDCARHQYALQRSTYNPQPYSGWGVTPGGQQEPSVWSNFCRGFLNGYTGQGQYWGQLATSVSGGYNYGYNPYMMQPMGMPRYF